jgi:dihydropteroate synthase
VSQGVEFVRVHDVLANVRAARMAEAVLARAQP